MAYHTIEAPLSVGSFTNLIRSGKITDSDSDYAKTIKRLAELENSKKVYVIGDEPKKKNVLFYSVSSVEYEVAELAFVDVVNKDRYSYDEWKRYEKLLNDLNK